MKTYTVDHYIQKFEEIPDEKWYDGGFYHKYGNKDCRCALGWCMIDEGKRGFTDGGYMGEFHQLNRLFDENLKIAVHIINDGKSKQYQQEHPKKRVLAALNDIKKKLGG